MERFFFVLTFKLFPELVNSLYRKSSILVLLSDEFLKPVFGEKIVD